jgi:hypothetical protein
VIHAVAMAVAQGQFQLDQASLHAAEYMSGQMLLRDMESGQLLTRAGEPAGVPTVVDTRVLFGTLIDDDGHRVPNRLSMMELGFVPSFYQFVETVVDVKLTVRLRRQETETRVPDATAAEPAMGRRRPRTVITATPVDARYSGTYNFSADMTSTVRTKLVPVPPPAVLEQRILAELAARDDPRTKAQSAAREARHSSRQPLGGPDFDGTRCYEIGDAAVAKALAGRAFTAEAWVWPRGLFGRLAVVGAWKDTGTRQPGWLLGVEDARFVFALSSDGQSGVTTVTARAGVVSESWQHLAAVYDGKEMLLYVNGQLSHGSAEPSGDVAYPDAVRLLIGADATNDPRARFSGRIDDVRLWHRARTAAEIKRDMNYRLSGDEPGLAGYWRLDRASEDTVPDTTMGKHDARRCPP